MIIDTTQSKIELRLQRKLDIENEIKSLPKFKMCNFTVDEKKWIRAFNAMWAQSMKDTYGYDPNECLAAGESDES